MCDYETVKIRIRPSKPHWEIVMGQAPLNRDEQIKFMKNARERRAEAVERWSKSEMIQSKLGYEYSLKDALRHNPTIINAGDDISAVALARIEELEAKLAKAVAFLQDQTGAEWPYDEDAKRILAELKGEKDG